MGIQKCKKCGTKFNYKALLKPLWGVSEPLQCSNCRALHHVTWISRFAIQTLIMLPVFFKNGIRSFAPNYPLALLAYLVYFAIIKVLSPYLIRYKLVESTINKV